MADVAVENKEVVVEKKIVAGESDSVKELATEVPVGPPDVVATENGKIVAEVIADKDSDKDLVTENGDCEAVPIGVSTNVNKEADEPKVDATDNTEDSTSIENGIEESTNGDTNGDAADAAPAETVKRKLLEAGDAAADSAEVTPEKKSKLEEASKDEVVQVGAEASEIAA